MLCQAPLESEATPACLLGSVLRLVALAAACIPAAEPRFHDLVDLRLDWVLESGTATADR